MSLYVVADGSRNEGRDRDANTNFRVIIYRDGILPMFTSPESFSWFVRARHSAQAPIKPIPVEVDPLRLANMVKHLEATAGLRHLILDPRISSAGRWLYMEEPMSVSAYLRYTLELVRKTKRLRAEGRTKLRDEFSDPEELDKAVTVWIALQAEKVNADAHALVAEWEIEDGS